MNKNLFSKVLFCLINEASRLREFLTPMHRGGIKPHHEGGVLKIHCAKSLKAQPSVIFPDDCASRSYRPAWLPGTGYQHWLSTGHVHILIPPLAMFTSLSYTHLRGRDPGADLVSDSQLKKPQGPLYGRGLPPPCHT